jgi:hypothetical protein
MYTSFCKSLFILGWLWLLLFGVCQPAVGQTTQAAPAQLSGLPGKWTGKLTYLDYTTQKPTDIPANILITAKSERAWTFAFQYPDEPKANEQETYTLSTDGSRFRGHEIVSSENNGGTPNSTFTLITTTQGKDNRQKVTIRHTLVLGPSSLVLIKEVRKEGETSYFERNRYTLTR